ncbi:MFS general substrate transporter [Lindgomyces ingoldianus]|uniref:MFS general substrate transporter n=1 Tax=Lindgomyces ingoldianus TaxID=673940 RepID=A0ACB6QSQ0_9PLEO|nr:MFS general substrate transporter [Lindgomyces ingoldianus]KAF2470034.1 MFS general substrate transporter [Lindgomyces ingoldianus]
MTLGDEIVEEGPGGSYTPSEFERLGRERPEAFSSIWTELGFCFSLIGSIFAAEYFTSGFNILLPVLTTALQIPSQAETWPASVFSLVTGAFLLPSGRLADMFGGKVVFVSGLIWFLVWSIVAGFSQNYTMLIICRALQGLGPAAFLPSGIMLLGSLYRPGPRKNLVFSLYGAFAPVGFFAGIFFAGVSAQLISWRWFFFFGSIMLWVVTIASYLTIPSDQEERKDCEVRMDWLGTFTIVPGLLLVVFAITDGSHAQNGWATPYIPVTFVIGWLFLAGTVYVEGWLATQPLLPRDMLDVKGMKALVVALFFQYGVFGIYLFYASFYIEEILHASPLLTTAWFSPMCVGGLILATIGGLILHLLPGTTLLGLSGICYILSVVLFAIIPTNPNYWAYIFPAMICATAGIDITYNVTNIFITTSMPKSRQGLAGALINSMLFIGISFFLGFADLAVTQTAELGQRESYKVAFWFATGCSVVGLIVMFWGVQIGKAESRLTVEEREELERELKRRSSHHVGH